MCQSNNNKCVLGAPRVHCSSERRRTCLRCARVRCIYYSRMYHLLPLHVLKIHIGYIYIAIRLLGACNRRGNSNGGRLENGLYRTFDREYLCAFLFYFLTRRVHSLCTAHALHYSSTATPVTTASTAGSRVPL
jgi:hypothetical protein